MEQRPGSKLGKEYKAMYCHPVYTAYMQSTPYKMPDEIKLSWNQDFQDKYQQPQIYRWHHSKGRKRRGIKEPLDEGERGEWKSWLKTQHLKHYNHGIWSHHFMANWRGKKWKQWQIIFSWAPKSLQMVTAAMRLKNTCSLGKKAMKNLDSLLKNKDITFPIKVQIVKAMLFPVVMYGYESWTIKKVEYQRIDAFKVWCWRRLLRVPWTARR